MKDLFKIILKSTLFLAPIVITGLAVCAFSNDERGTFAFMIMLFGFATANT